MPQILFPVGIRQETHIGNHVDVTGEAVFETKAPSRSVLFSPRLPHRTALFHRGGELVNVHLRSVDDKVTLFTDSVH